MELKRSAAFFLIIGYLALGSNAEITEEDTVLVLTEENFQEAIDTYNYLLVEFYAPWCGHCKKLAPEYWAASKNLRHKESPARLAKVDATEQKELAKQHGVKGYPTLKFFKNGKAIEYTGGRTEDTIVAWVTKKSGDPAQLVESVEAAQELIEQNKVVVIGFFKDLESEDAKEFVEVADSVDQVFAITSSADVMAKYEMTGDGVLLFKQFDEGKAAFEGEITKDTLENWITANSIPLVIELSPETSQAVFGNGDREIFFVFSADEGEEKESREDTLKKIAKEYRGELVFTTVNTQIPQHKKVIDFFGVLETELPTYRIAKIGSSLAKYKPESVDFSEDSLRSFVKQYKAGELKPHLKIQDLPEDWDSKPVKVLTGGNFQSVAFDAEKDVFVKFYAPWCGHCKKIAPIWDELADKLKDDPTVVIAKLDSTLNELAEVEVRGFPTLKLFKKGDNTIVDYNGGRELKDLLKFIRPEVVIEEPDVEVEEDVKTEEKEKKDEL